MDSQPHQVRRAIPGDEPLLRALRIQAMSEAPDAFGTTLERELARTASDWQRWLSTGATFILVTPSGPSGMAVGMPDVTDPALVYLMAMWVHPDMRGSGAADLLVAAVLAWAEEVGAQEICLDVIESNDKARRLYERHHFRPTGQTTRRARDGAIEVEMGRLVGPRSGVMP